MGIAEDMRFALRIFARSPGLTATVVLTLAVAMGADTAIFTVVNALLLRPLPYSDSGRLVLLSGKKESANFRGGPLSWPRFTLVQEESRAFSGVAAFTPEEFNLSGHGDPRQVASARVSWNFFDVLGVRPAAGRWFRREEDRAGGDPVVLISHALWTGLFGGDPSLIGRHLALDGADYSVIGVLPADFRFGLLGSAIDIVAPRVFDLNIITPQQANTGTGFLLYVGRLAVGVRLSQAQAEMDTLAAQYRHANPKFPDADPNLTVQAGSLRDEMVASARPTVLVLFGAVSLVLLIACANVAGLLLSRGLGRRREIAVRMAMGASRATVVRQLLLESGLLAVAGGLLGALASAWGTSALVSMAGSNLPRSTEIHTDGYVLAFTLAVALATGLAFGLAPAMRLSHPDLNTDLRSEGRGSTAGRQSNALRGVLVVAQVALSLVLLIGAGLLIRNFAQLRSASPGFDANHLLTLKLSLPPARYAGAAKLTAFYDELLRAARSVPGVGAAAESSALPLNPIRFSPALPEGQPEVPLVERPVFNIQTISPGFVETLRLRLVRGREFTAHDDAAAARVTVVNETLARRYWPREDAVGKHILVGRQTVPFEVVGVVGDIRNANIAADVQPEIYLPFAQLPWPTMHLLVRTAGDPHGAITALRKQVAALDRDLPVTGVQTMDEVFDTAAAQPRFTTALLGALSAIALLLAVVGIYGTIACAVAERTQEVGIRVALGAGRGDVLRLVLREGLMLALAGIAVGLAASFAVTRLLASLLYRVSPTDPLTFAAGAALFAAVALAASYVPARRAVAIDPIRALRWE